MTNPHPINPAYYLTQAQKILNELHGSSPRDRVAFAYGYILAFNAMAGELTPDLAFHHHAIASALHDLCARGT